MLHNENNLWKFLISNDITLKSTSIVNFFKFRQICCNSSMICFVITTFKWRQFKLKSRQVDDIVQPDKRQFSEQKRHFKYRNRHFYLMARHYIGKKRIVKVKTLYMWESCWQTYLIVSKSKVENDVLSVFQLFPEVQNPECTILIAFSLILIPNN